MSIIAEEVCSTWNKKPRDHNSTSHGKQKKQVWSEQALEAHLRWQTSSLKAPCGKSSIHTPNQHQQAEDQSEQMHEPFGEVPHLNHYNN